MLFLYTCIPILITERVEAFIFSCLERMQTDGDEWGRYSIVAATTVAGLTVASAIMLSLHHAEKNRALFA